MTQSLFALSDVQFWSVLTIENLEIAPNVVTSIIGRSGSGKSTLMRLLNRMISPDTGTIIYRGESVAEIDAVELRRKVVMLPQSPVMFEGNIRENVLKGLEFSERPAISDTEIMRLLQIVGIGHSPDTSTANLSGGERQRVAIARVLAMTPDVLLLDEPSSALDSSTQDEVIEKVLAEAKAQGTTVIMVTHATAMAERWSDAIIEIEAGKIASVRNGAAHG